MLACLWLPPQPTRLRRALPSPALQFSSRWAPDWPGGSSFLISGSHSPLCSFGCLWNQLPLGTPSLPEKAPWFLFSSGLLTERMFG